MTTTATAAGGGKSRTLNIGIGETTTLNTDISHLLFPREQLQSVHVSLATIVIPFKQYAAMYRDRQCIQIKKS